MSSKVAPPELPPELPQLVEPEILQIHLDNAKILIVDLSRAEGFADAHIPGAIWLDYASIIAARPPAGGVLPDLAQLDNVFSALGLTKDTHVVAYDRDGNTKASRLLWTLDVLGHHRSSLLNGGFAAWIDEGRPVESGETGARPRSDFHGAAPGPARADKEYILAHLKDPKVVVVDCRSAAEFSGADRRAARPGHIPGAVNFDWVQAVDRVRATRMRKDDELLAALAALGVTPDKEAIVLCQTHHRSAHTYMALKALGFARVRGYDGSWSEWGNDPNLPVEV
jgi:thiosulfate/3-mercaptopyruvate sulfurtransferase